MTDAEKVLAGGITPEDVADGGAAVQKVNEVELDGYLGEILEAVKAIEVAAQTIRADIEEKNTCDTPHCHAAYGCISSCMRWLKDEVYG